MKLTRLVIREWAESLAVAFILAMIIRHYVVEAFRIPTSSMEPTLLGRSVGGDRILVSKFQYDLHPPNRWDIIVFKIDQTRIDYYRELCGAPPPASGSILERGRFEQRPNGILAHEWSAQYVNYVKRLVGLPGERIQVRNGDVYINGKIARKPESIQDALLVPVTNDERRHRLGERFLDRWEVHPGGRIREEGDVVRFLAAGTEKGVFVTLRGPVTDRLPGRDRRDARFSPVGDLKLVFRFRRTGGAGELLGRLTEDGTQYRFSLPLDGPDKTARLLCDGREIGRAAAPPLASGEHRVEFSNLDDRVTLKVDGRTVLVHDFDRSADEPPPPFGTRRNGVTFGASGCDVEVRDVRVWRDIHYTADPQHRFGVKEPFTLASDEYFVLGDNSSNSFDSRNWGVVKRSHLIGEAFFVFWPLPRWRFIH